MLFAGQADRPCFPEFQPSAIVGKCVISYQGCLCIIENCWGGKLGRLSLALCAGFLFLCQREGGFWFDFVYFDFTARARDGAQTELPPLAELQIQGSSLPGFSEEITELHRSDDSTATQSYLSTGDFFFFQKGIISSIHKQSPLQISFPRPPQG